MATLAVSSSAPAARRRSQCSARAAAQRGPPTDSGGWAQQKRIQELQRELEEKDRQLRALAADNRDLQKRLERREIAAELRAGGRRLSGAVRALFLPLPESVPQSLHMFRALAQKRLALVAQGSRSAVNDSSTQEEASRAEEKRRNVQRVGQLNALSYFAFFVMVVFDIWLAGKSLPQ